jgi:multiple sugar transport system substrate-binding protein
MAELRFSAIGDDSESIAEVARLAKEYQDASGVKVDVIRQSWERAWQNLLRMAIEGKGADMSQVGSTWAPTLAALDSLRPFSESEIRSLGGASIFAPATWESTQIAGEREVWAIPWSAYTFVVFYRRDLLQRAGMDESDAFSTPEAMIETFRALQKAGIAPWAIPTSSHYLDLPHIASSWLRAHGGECIGVDGKSVQFNSPPARKGLAQFFDLFRFIPPHLQEMEYGACLERFFTKGETAVLIGGAESYSDAIATNTMADELREKIGVAATPGIPWIGGDHLVIWKTARADTAKERAAVDLIRSFVSVENQVRLSRETTILPARLDAYPQLEFQPEGMRAVLEKTLKIARPHPSLRLWRRIESMLADMFGEIARSVLQSPQREAVEIVEPKLAEYEKRFSLILGG